MLSFLKKNFLVLIICFFAITGFFASFDLSLEKIALVQDPSHVASCSLNEVFNCTTVMKTKYAQMFGFPNSFIGVAGYPMAFITGLFFIQSTKNGKFITWLTTSLTFLAFCISYYWLYLSAYVIGVFCPWCLISTTSATCIFFAIITLHLYENNFDLSSKKHDLIKRKIDGQWNVGFVIIWFIAVACFAYFPFLYSMLS
jgi:uncharacterized membrane protein